MIDFSGYTAKAIEKAMLDQVPDHIDTREGSMIQTALGPVAWYLEGLYMTLGHVQENAYADTAAGEYLDLIVQQRGLFRNKAVPAVRKGIFNTTVSTGARFKTVNGGDSVIFLVGSRLTDHGDGYIYKMVCQTSGLAGNNYAGSLLPITAVPGLTSAVLGEIITAGAEEESDESLRSRYFETFRMEAFGGNIQSYRNEILAIAGVGAVQVYPVWNGGGTVLCSILGSDFKPALPALVQTVQNIICPPEEGETEPSANGYGKAPIGAAVTITTGSPLVLDIACEIDFVSGLQNGEEACRQQIEERIQEYLDAVNQTWGKPLAGYKVDYSVTVYISRIIYALLTISDIVNVSNVRINGSESDLRLIENADLQQVAVLGEVVINHG